MGNHIHGHRHFHDHVKSSSNGHMQKIRLLVLGYIRVYIQLTSIKRISIPSLVEIICSKYYGNALINCIFQCKIDRYGYLLSIEESNKFNEKRHRSRIRNDSLKLSDWEQYLFAVCATDNNLYQKKSQQIDWNSILNTAKLKTLIHKSGIAEAFRPLLWNKMVTNDALHYNKHTFIRLINANESPFYEEIWKDINIANKNHTRFGLYTYAKEINHMITNEDDLYEMQQIDDDDIEERKNMKWNKKYSKRRRKRYRLQRQKLSHCTRSAIMLASSPYLKKKDNMRRGASVGNLHASNHQTSHERKYCVTYFKHKVIDTNYINRCGHNNVDVYQVQKHATKTQKQLYNVLKAFSLFRKEIGYTSNCGLSVIAGLLLLYMNEEEVFYFLNELCNDKYNMLNIWKPTMPQMKLILFQTERLIEKHLNKVSNHLKTNRMQSSLMFYAQNWFKTLFAQCNVAIISMDILFRIWDCYFNDGFVVLFRFAIGILKYYEHKLLKTKNIDDVIDVLQNKEDHIMNQDAFMKMCLSFKITKHSVDKLQFASL